MQFILLIIVGAFLGILVQRFSLKAKIPSLALILLLCVLFLMGLELPLETFSVTLLLRALFLGLMSMAGSILLLSVTLFLIKRYGQHARSR